MKQNNKLMQTPSSIPTPMEGLTNFLKGIVEAALSKLLKETSVQDVWFTPSQLKKYLNVSQHTLNDLIHKGIIDKYCLDGNIQRFKKSEIDNKFFKVSYSMKGVAS